MKKVFLLYSFIFLSIFLFACTKKATVRIHYNDEIITKKVEIGSIINFDNIYDSEYILVGYFNEDYTISYDNQKVLNDLDIYALLEEKGIQYKIHYDLDGGKWDENHPTKYLSGYEEELVDPIKDNHYAFDGWILNGEKITKISDTMFGDVTLTATWKDVAKYFTINFDNIDINPITIREDDTFVLPSAKKEGYYFRGWYTDSKYSTLYNNEITKDTTLYPKFVEATSENTYISFLGDSITTFKDYIPSDYIEYYPQGDVTSVTDTWWYQVYNNLGYNLLVNDSYSGTLVTSGNNYGASDERIDNLSKDGISPDIVIIHMGTNDFTHMTNATSFKNAYITMIEKIKNKYDDVIIYVCTHPSNNYNDSFISIRLNFNEIIKEIASTYDLKVLDLTNIINDNNHTSYMWAGAHPNKAGMKLIADYITNEIKKETNN